MRHASEAEEYIAIRLSQIQFYRRTPLYIRSDAGGYTLYKPAGYRIPPARLETERLPNLFIRASDRLNAMTELKKAFQADLQQKIDAGDGKEIKSTLCNLVGETLAEPRSGMLGLVPDAVGQLVASYSSRPEFVRALAYMANKDYTTAIHSVNVMALTVGFCMFMRFPAMKTRRYGTAALLHDVGKINIPTSILAAARRLTEEEFEIVQRHPLEGRDLLVMEGGIRDELVLQGVVEHHERLNGSGYPRGIRNLSEIGRVLSLIDCYESLTNEDRPYRRAATPFEALRMIKEEVDAGRFPDDLFRTFCYSQKTD